MRLHLTHNLSYYILLYNIVYISNKYIIYLALSLSVSLSLVWLYTYIMYIRQREYRWCVYRRAQACMYVCVPEISTQRTGTMNHAKARILPCSSPLSSLISVHLIQAYLTMHHCKGKLGEKGPKPWLMKRGLFKVLFHANIQNLRTKSIWVSKRREKERICVIEKEKER